MSKTLSEGLHISTTITDYTYDPLYRLTGANYSGAITSMYAYSYDAVGNRLTQNVNGSNMKEIQTCDSTSLHTN